MNKFKINTESAMITISEIDAIIKNKQVSKILINKKTYKLFYDLPFVWYSFVSNMDWFKDKKPENFPDCDKIFQVNINNKSIEKIFIPVYFNESIEDNYIQLTYE